MYITNLRESNKSSKFPIEVGCEKCGTEFCVEENDRFNVGYHGTYYVNCPVCGERVIIYELDGIKVTKDNIKFPDHFYDFRDGVKISNEEIEEYIRKGIESDLINLANSNNSMENLLKCDSNGFAITSSMNSIIANSMYKNSPIRQLARIVNISNDLFYCKGNNPDATPVYYQLYRGRGIRTMCNLCRLDVIFAMYQSSPCPAIVALFRALPVQI
jgi:hypothetical protein